MASFTGASLLGQIGVNAEELRKEGRSCILVWLSGAPSQMETWDPKPGTANGGSTKAIATAVPGVRIAHYFPKLAKSMKDLAIVRSVAGKEAAHERGTYHLHTGYRMGGPLKYPNFGSVVAHQLGDPNSEIPNFVSIGKTPSSGYLGVQVAPFVVSKAGQLPQNVASGVPSPKMQRRLALLKEQDRDFGLSGAGRLVEEHQALYAKASKMMKSPKLNAFQLADESASLKEAYGKGALGQGLLVARRLVEVGVPFVEVQLGGWDMHSNIYKSMPVRGKMVDDGVSQLIADLKQRGLLEKTLVVCMGEFGRTPKLNTKTPAPGRDHWAKNFNVLMAGGNIQGGRVVGKTDANGQEIIDRPVAVEDLFATFCTAINLDPDTELDTPLGRTVPIVEEGTKIDELFV